MYMYFQMRPVEQIFSEQLNETPLSPVAELTTSENFDGILLVPDLQPFFTNLMKHGLF